MNLRRKRLRLMRNTQWRGYLRTATGNPITVSQLRSVANLSVLGNSIQDGTPSPDNPVEVVGSGDKTPNIFDYKYFFENAVVQPQGTTIALSYNLKINTMYTVYTNVPVSVANYCSVFATSGGIRNVTTAGDGISIGSPRTITTDDSGMLTLHLRTIDYPDAIILNKEDFTSVKYWVAVVEGTYTADTLPQYEPYGYKIGVSAHGRNLFDYEYFFENAVNVQDSSISVVYTLEKNTEYTVYTNVPLSSAGYVSVFAITGEQFYVSTRNDGVSLGNPRIIMTDDLGRLTLHLRTIEYPNTITLTKEDFTSGKYWVALVKGTYTVDTLPEYEPYKVPQSFNIYTPQPLHGVGDSQDTVLLDFDNKKAQLIKQYEHFKVNEIQWSRSSDSYDGERTTDRYHMYTGLYSGKNSTDDSKCNVLPKYNGVIWTNDTQGFTWNSAQLHLRINNDVLGITTRDTAEERTSKFTSYTQNNDIYVLGKLITPVVTDITSLQQWEIMPNLKGTLILTASGGTEPVIAAEYYSNERSIE